MIASSNVVEQSGMHRFREVDRHNHYPLIFANPTLILVNM